MSEHNEPHHVDIPSQDISELDLDSILEPGRALKHLSELRESYNELDEVGGKAARRAMLSAYGIAIAALHNEDLWSEICGAAIWAEKNFKRRPKLQDQADALKFAIRLSVGFGGVGANSVVSKRYLAMKPSFDLGRSTSEVRDLLSEHRGAEGLAAWEKRQMSSQQTGKEVREQYVVLRLVGKQINVLTLPRFRDFTLKISKVATRGKVITATAKVIEGPLNPPKPDDWE